MAEVANCERASEDWVRGEVDMMRETWWGAILFFEATSSISIPHKKSPMTFLRMSKVIWSEVMSSVFVAVCDSI
jgi:hypothetical protein